MQVSFKNADPREAHVSARPETASIRGLSDLREGEEAVIAHIDLPGDLAHRLMELGFLPGMKVTAARSAPGGDPRVFQVDGAEIALRRDTASRLLVES